MNKNYLWLVICYISCITTVYATLRQPAIVTNNTVIVYPHMQQTQDDYLVTDLLYGDRVFLEQEEGERVKVLIADQLDFISTEGRWRYCEGWVPKNAVIAVDKFPYYNAIMCMLNTAVFSSPNLWRAIETCLPLGVLCKKDCISLRSDKLCSDDMIGISYGYGVVGYVHPSQIYSSKFTVDAHEIQNIRAALAGLAHRISNTPYKLGGRSLAGMDCSGLVSLLYKSYGFTIPRYSRDQEMLSTKIAFKDLMPGDLVFVRYAVDRSRVRHVLMYLGDEMLIEASGDAKKVRVINFYEKFGVCRSQLGDEKFELNYCTISAGSLLSDMQRVQKYRDLWYNPCALVGNFFDV